MIGCWRDDFAAVWLDGINILFLIFSDMLKCLVASMFDAWRLLWDV